MNLFLFQFHRNRIGKKRKKYIYIYVFHPTYFYWFSHLPTNVCVEDLLIYVWKKHSIPFAIWNLFPFIFILCFCFDCDCLCIGFGYKCEYWIGRRQNSQLYLHINIFRIHIYRWMEIYISLNPIGYTTKQ